MKLLARALLVCLLLAGQIAGQTTESALTGLKLGKAPEGVVVEDVLAGSPAATAGLLPHDVLLTLDSKALTDGNEFLRLAAVKATHGKVPLVLLRKGQRTTLMVSLISPPRGDAPKASLKPGGPPAVAVYAKKLDGGKMSVTFTFYSKDSSKLESVKLSGSLDDIKKKVKDAGQRKGMPSRVCDLADVAVDRLRVLNGTPQK